MTTGRSSDPRPLPARLRKRAKAERRRVVIVDDSDSLRALLRRTLEADGRFEVVGEAGDPFEARAVIKAGLPDVVTLDVEMPRMDGLSFLEKIITLRPMPVVMLSSGTRPGSEMAVRALARGAIDCIGKDMLSAPGAAAEAIDRIFEASLARVGPRAARPVAPDHESFSWNGRLVLIGASTGGVEALERVLGGLPSNGPPVAVVQHMPAVFLESLVHRFSGLLAPRVVLARDGMQMSQGTVVFAPGGASHLELHPERGPNAPPVCRLLEGPPEQGHRPSVDRLFASAGPFAGQVLAVLLTGMGRDGAGGMLALRRAGAGTLAQSRESSTVWGMPRVAREIGAAQRLIPLEGIAAEILKQCGKSRGEVS